MATTEELQIEERASRAYQAFCESSAAWMPMYRPDWPLLPDAVKTAWKAAVVAAMKSK
jgi:hypothetical protein